MVDRVASESEPEILYDILLKRRPPEFLQSRYPSMTICTTEAQTALRRRVQGQGQLDVLLQKVCSVGLALTDIRRLPAAAQDRAPSESGPPRAEVADPGGGSAGCATYEVRVAGVLGAPLLRYLRWSHYDVPEQTLVRLAAAAPELHSFLRACTDYGSSIERVRRVAPAPSSMAGTLPAEVRD
jgi:hypothetical protein